MITARTQPPRYPATIPSSAPTRVAMCDLTGIVDRDEEFKLPAGRGDELARGGGADPLDKPKPIVGARDMFSCLTFISIR
jgi:hypothetical protein